MARLVAGPTARADRRLVNLFLQRARDREDRGDEAGALADLEQAFGLDPAHPKAAARYLAKLLSSDELTGDEARLAHELVQQVGQPALPSTGASAVASVDELVQAVEAHCDGAQSVLAIIEIGVPREHVDELLGRCASRFALVSSETRLADVTLAAAVVPLIEAWSYSFEGDAALCRLTDGFSASIRAVCREELPRPLWTACDLDLIEYLSFELDDAVLYAGRKLRALSHLVTSGRFEKVVILTGNGQLTEAATPLLEKVFGTDACLRVDTRRGTAHTGSLPDLERPPQTATGPSPVSPAPFENHLRRLASASRASGAHDPDGPVVLLANPFGRNVTHLVDIFRELPDDVPGVGVTLSKRIHHLPGYRDFFVFASETPDRFTLDFRFADTPVLAPDERTRLDTLIDNVVDRPELKSYAVDDLPLYPLVAPALRRILLTRLATAREFAEAFSARLEALRPRAVVVAPDRVMQARVGCELARRMGIPSVFPQVDQYSSSPRFKPLQADYVAVIDDRSRRLYQDRFRAIDEQIVVTGISRFDEISDRLSTQGGFSIRDPSDPAVGEKRIVLALQPLSIDTNLELIAATVAAISTAEEARLTVKLHPRENPSNRHAYAQCIEEQSRAHGTDPERIEMVWEEGIYEVLERATLVISMFSAVVIEAAIFGRIVVCVSLSGEPLPIPYVEQGVAVGAFSRQELQSVITNLLRDRVAADAAISRLSEYFARNPHFHGRPARKAVAELIATVAASPGTAVNHLNLA